MKKVSWKYLLLVIGCVVGLGLIAGLIMGLISGSGSSFLIVAIICWWTLGILALLSNVDTNFITERLMKKAIEENAGSNNFLNCSTFTTHNAILKIDEQTGRLAYICNLNPKEFQVISAKNITGIKSDYIKAPLGGTNYVYFQFVYEGKRFRIPTFTARKCVYSLKSAEVLEAMSKADAYAEMLQRAKNAAQ